MKGKNLHIKKNDVVKVIAGSQKGKTAKILHINMAKETVLLEGVNIHKKHARPSQERPKGGIIDMEAPLDISNVMLVCPRCNKITRVNFKKLEDGKNVRVCKKCHEIVDKV